MSSACINNANTYSVTVTGITAPAVWIDQKGAQTGLKNMLIVNTGSNTCELAANQQGLQPNQGAGFHLAPGQFLIINSVRASHIKWYAICATGTTTLDILEAIP